MPYWAANFWNLAYAYPAHKLGNFTVWVLTCIKLVDFTKADFELLLCGSETWRNKRKKYELRRNKREKDEFRISVISMSGLRVKMN